MSRGTVPHPSDDIALDGRLPEPTPERPERRRLLPAAVATILVVSAAGSWLLLGRDTGATGDGSGGAGRRATATVERRDLIQRETFDGSLGFDDERTLSAGLAGILTWIADEGATLRRGDRLYEVNGRPVVLLYGSIPLFRPLAPGVEGDDVRQLERNLAAMGFTDGGALDVDGEFDDATADAVRDWQDEVGVDETGVVQPGEAAFFPGPRRLGAHQLDVGDAVAPGAPVASITATARVVTVELDATDQDLASRGADVRITLPSGRRLAGRIVDVGSVAEADPNDPTAEPTVTIAIRPAGRVGQALDQAPVDVEIELDRANDALAVPVAALLALAEGGYALEVIGPDGDSELTAIEVGAFADGWVEVSGEGIDEGTRVVTAA
jgi:peptidoglycan hydrolase-like protein with peptidoglycan-binding domain